MKHSSSTTLAQYAGQEIAHPGARLAMTGKLEDRAGQRQGCLVGRHARQPLAHSDRLGQVLAVQLVQDRLVIEKVELRRPAAHEQVDDPPGLGPMMRRGQHAAIRRVDRPSRRDFSGLAPRLFSRRGCFGQQRSQGGRTQPQAGPREEMAAIDLQIGIIGRMNEMAHGMIFRIRDCRSKNRNQGATQEPTIAS